MIQTISAAAGPAAAARALGVPEGDMMVRVERRYLGAADAPVQISINWHRMETFTYSMSIKREDSA